MTTGQLIFDAALVAAVALAAFGLGWWVARGRSLDEIGELEEELDRAIARHPAGKHRPDALPVAGRLELLPAPMWEYKAEHRELAGQVVQAPVVSDEEWLAARVAAMHADIAGLIGRTDGVLGEVSR